MAPMLQQWESLLEAAKGGDREAADQLARLLFDWTWRELPGQETADREDLAISFAWHLIRDGFVRLPEPRSGCPIRFLRCALKRFRIDWWRRESRHREHEIPFSQISDETRPHPDDWSSRACDPLQSVLAGDYADRVQTALEGLSAENQLLFIDWCRGASYTELAAALNLRVPTVKQRLHSVRYQIRKRLHKSSDS